MDPNYPSYEVDFNTVLQGINNYKEKIHVITKSGEADNVSVLYYKTVEINDRNDLKISVKPEVRPFISFEDYKIRLIDSTCRMALNAADQRRFHQFKLVTTISKGYDAPCCAAIAKHAGCNTAVTYKADGKYAEDSGVEIARKLGYTKIIEKDAQSYKERKDLTEADYICSGELGAQISFSAFDEEFKGNLIFTGDRGDSIWGRYCAHRNNEFHFIDMLSHIGSSERRLWIGFISVPMPLYGATAWKSIYDISNSDEMKKWCMNNEYDRPIPRRIVEESGVPREWFGTNKHGAGFYFHYDWMSRILKKMSPSSAADFKKYVSQQEKTKVSDVAMYFAKTLPIYLNRIHLGHINTNIERQSQVTNPMATRYLIPWSGDIVQNKYKRILQNDNEHEE